MDQVKLLLGIDGPFEGYLNVYIKADSEKSRDFFDIKAGEFRKAPQGLPPPRAFVISDEAALDLSRQLWSRGYRPAESKQSAGQFEAQSAHLEDMRRIAFRKLGFDKGGEQ